MKSFEVNLVVIGGTKEQTRKVFVSAESKELVENCEGVAGIWERPDIPFSECPMEVIVDVITEKHE